LAAPSSRQRALAPVRPAGQLEQDAGAWVLKIARESLDLLHSICARSFVCTAANRGP
jgi:hypothetical protein